MVATATYIIRKKQWLITSDVTNTRNCDLMIYSCLISEAHARGMEARQIDCSKTNE